MSWISKLSETYDNCIDKVGIPDDEGNVLLPIGHSTQNAQIEVVLDVDGNFLEATRVIKEEAETIIPVTEDSASRSSGITPHPLHDKLIYVAGDYRNYVSEQKEIKKSVESFEKYIEGLKKWSDSEYSNPKVKAVYTYLSQKKLIKDLLEVKVLILDEQGMLNVKEKINGIFQTDVFIRFRVEDIGDPNDESKLWKSKKIYEDFQKYCMAAMSSNGICYVMGKESYCSDKHSGKIRHAGDKSKIISANDAGGFTYRGRFADKEEACSVSYDISQKAHNALKWIIQRENIRIDEMVMIAFRVKDAAMVDIGISQNSEFFDDLDENYEDTSKADLSDNGESYAKKLKKNIFSSGIELFDDDEIILMTLEAATTGRLSITYYREMTGSHYKRNIEKWKSECKWYYKDNKRDKDVDINPSLYSIVRASYGVQQGNFIEVKSKLQKLIISRLIPCIIDAKPLPRDIVIRAVYNVSNPCSYSYKNWRNVLGNACAMIYKYYKEKGVDYKMELEERKERDYLYGRLLAIAEIAERTAMGADARGERNTNAQRYMVAFQKRPFTTWLEIRKKIQPYFNKMNPRQSEVYQSLMDSIINSFDYKDFTNNNSLNGTYLLGYSNQMNAGVHIIKEDNKNE